MGQDCSRADNAADGGGGQDGSGRRRTTKKSKAGSYMTGGAGGGESDTSGGGNGDSSGGKKKKRTLRKAADNTSGDDEDGGTEGGGGINNGDGEAAALGGGAGGASGGPIPAGLQSLSHTSTPIRNFTVGPPGTITSTFLLKVGPSHNLTPTTTNNDNASSSPPPQPLSTKFREYHSPIFGGAATEGFLTCVSAEGVLPLFAHNNTATLPPPKKGMVLCAGEDKNIYYVNYETGHVIRTFRKAHTRDVKLLTRPINGVFFSGGRDGAIKQWSLDAAAAPSATNDADTPTMVYKGHSLIVTALAPLFRGSTAAAGAEVGSGGVAKPWCGASRLVSGSRDNTVKLWDIASGKCLSSVDVKLNLVHFLHEVGGGPGGAGLAAGMVAQGGEDLTVRLWDTRLDNNGSLSLVSTMANFDYHPLCAASRGDTPTIVQQQPSSASPSSSSSISNNYMYTGHNGFNGKGSMIMEWDLRMQKSTRRFLGHTMSVRCMCFARLVVPATSEFLEGGEVTVLVTASDDGTIKLWNVDSPHTGISSTAAIAANNNTSGNKQQFIASISIPEGKVNSIDQSALTGKLILGMQSGSVVVLDAVQALECRKVASSTAHEEDGGESGGYEVEASVGVRYRYVGRPSPDIQ